jgi:hypothetical protein
VRAFNATIERNRQQEIVDWPVSKLGALKADRILTFKFHSSSIPPTAQLTTVLRINWRGLAHKSPMSRHLGMQTLDVNY